MCHLESRPLESALDVEPLVRLAAIKNALVAAHLGRDEIEGLDELESELLALLVLRNGDVLDVADKTKVVDAGMGLANIIPRESRALTTSAQQSKHRFLLSCLGLR